MNDCISDKLETSQQLGCFVCGRCSRTGGLLTFGVGCGICNLLKSIQEGSKGQDCVSAIK